MLKRKSLLALVIILIVLLGALFILNQKEESKNTAPVPNQEKQGFFSMEESREVAKNWIMNNSATYKYDGTNLKLKDSRQIGLKDVDSSVSEGSEPKCEDCFEFDFSFKSRHAGYGNREGKMLAQVITPHVITITIKSGQVTKAVVDEKYDAIDQTMINNQAGLNKSDQEKVKNYVNENIASLTDQEPSLGGNFYVNKILFLGNNKALVQYEDGHKAYVYNLDYSLSQGEVNVDSFQESALEVKKVAEVDFSEIGNMVSKEDNVQLVYEKPGAPALKKELDITNATCYEIESGSLIEKGFSELSWQEGERVLVNGVENDNKVMVNFLTILN